MKIQHKLSTNSEYISQLQRVGAKMAAVVPLPEKAWKFVVIDSGPVNAFVDQHLVCVHSGLFKITVDDAGLAVVLGHEMAHVVQREETRLRLGMCSKEYNKAVANIQANSKINPAKRHENEAEADRMGFLYMAKAGYDPHAAIQFWERAVSYSAAREHDSRTHPDVSLRLKTMKAYLPAAITEYRKYV